MPYDPTTMIQFLLRGLLWFSAIGCGIVAGIYFVFSTTVMTSLGRIAPDAGIAAMNAISADIVRSAFLPLFFGTTLAAATLAIWSLFRWGEPGVITMLAGGIIYSAGMFAVTVAFNVPMNNMLASVDPNSTNGIAYWEVYLRDWTYWNHIRAAASAMASILFTASLVAK
jgi:uncharacterized membrane protein